MARLRERVNLLLEHAENSAQRFAGLKKLGEVAQACRQKAAGPMRIAFIGGVNRGKSTLMNAFLGEKLAETGNKELTCNVSWFRYGEQRELRVHLRTTDKVDSFPDLGALTTRCDESPEFLDRIDFIEVFQPSPVLKNFDLIDTPGLYSPRPENSKITRRFLSSAETKPHAVIFLFCDKFREEDAKELDLFQSADVGVLSGINAIAAMTKAESLGCGFTDAEKIITQTHLVRPSLAKQFYRIVPVAGQSAFGAQTFTGSEMAALRALADLPNCNLEILLSDAKDFEQLDFGFGEPSSSARKDLFQRFGLWGIRRAVEIIAAGGEAMDVRDGLLAVSRFESLRDLVVGHFGKRAELIQCSGVLADIREVAFYSAERLHGDESEAANQIVREVDAIRKSDPRFTNFCVLEDHYNNVLRFEEHEIPLLLDITGESGNDCGARLGCRPLAKVTPEPSTVAELADKALEREVYWRSRSMSFPPPILAEAYRRLADGNADVRSRLLKASEHLKAAVDLLEF